MKKILALLLLCSVPVLSQSIRIDSGGSAGGSASATAPGLIFPSTRVELMDDFLGCFSIACQASLWQCSPAGTGASCQVTNANLLGVSDFGLGQVDTGTTATGAAGLSGSINMWPIGSGTTVFESRVYLDDLSDGTETYTATAGFIDVTTGARGVDSLGFSYTNAVNTGKWECFTRNNSVETLADSGITVVADTWYRLGIEVNAAGTSAGFSINGASVCTITTNIPTGVARASGVIPGFILKSVGLTQRNMYFDYTYVRVDLTTPR